MKALPIAFALYCLTVGLDATYAQDASSPPPVPAEHGTFQPQAGMAPNQPPFPAGRAFDGGFGPGQNPGPFRQPGGEAPRKSDSISDTELRQLVEAAMAARMAKDLGLNDEQTVVMVRRFGEFKEKLGALRRERQESLVVLKKAIKDSASDADIKAGLDKLMALDSKEAEYRKTAYEKACEGLSVSQSARMYVLLNDFENEMRRLVQKARARAAQRPGEGRMGPANPMGPVGPRPMMGPEMGPPPPFPPGEGEMQPRWPRNPGQSGMRPRGQQQWDPGADVPQGPPPTGVPHVQPEPPAAP